MYLEKIELHGFKSFANRTTIHFPKPPNKDNHGLTAIVGPNGSGKSNVIDALRWVLGEQSTKTLRGKKGKDVIFSGSQTKGRMGMAEVTLFFNNEDKSSPVDYTNIIITRRLYRDGESEYLLNKNKVRLHDIIMLLAQCNVGQKSYSIVGQGMITEIINATPTERKLFFDEATGIKQYQIQRDKAVNKVNRTEENIAQTHQILEELAPRLRLLKRQVNKLEQRKTLEAELRQNQGIYYSALWHNLTSEKQKSLDDSQKFYIEQQDLEKKLAEIQKTLEELSHQSSRQQRYTELQTAFNDLLFKKNQLTQELATVKGKTNIEYTKLGKQNLSWLELKEDEIVQKISTNKTETETLQETISQTEKNLKSEESALQNLKSEFESIDQRLIQLQKDDNNNFVNKKTHIKALLNYKEQFPGIHNTVNQLASVESSYAKALEIAAGRYTEAIVTDDEDTARECIKFLRANQLGTSTFLPLNQIKGRNIPQNAYHALDIPGVIGLAADLLDYDEKYDDIFSFIFGSTLLVDHIETAKKIGIGSLRMVTLEGDLLEQSGVIRGGYRRYRTAYTFQAKASAQHFYDKAEELEQKRLNLLQDIKEKDLHINEIKIDLEIKRSQINLLSNTSKSLEKELSSIKEELQDQTTAPENQESIVQKYLERKEQLQKEIELLDKEISLQRQEIDLFNAQEEEAKKKVFALQQDLQNYQHKLNETNSTLQNFQLQITRIDTKLEDLVIELQEELGEGFEQFINQEISDAPLEDIHIKIRKLKSKLSIIGGIDPEVITEYEEVSERHEFLDNQITDLEKALKDTKKIIKELDEIIKTQFNESFKKINKQFNHFFTKLFPGGKAKLELLQEQLVSDEEYSEDQEISPRNNKKITTGIDIIASPGNKKITNMSMMSGGEKTMTSIALISAIISNTAPPFVFLDEVDAALDEANSDKLATILEELAHFTQFIVITHNRVVMHAADILYGVAMGQDGITQLLSLNINEAEKLAQES